jgi:hypothetical protein
MQTRTIATVLAAGLAMSAAAFGDITGSFRIEATGQNGTGYWELPASALPPPDANGMTDWTLSSPYTIRNGAGEALGRVDTMQIQVVNDPVINIIFGVVALGVNQTFTISSALLAFPAIAMPEGRATAGVTVTDDLSFPDGASATPVVPATKLYQATYNGLVPGGTTFATLVGPVVAGVGDTNTVNESFPAAPGVFQLIGVPVSDMSARFNFTLSANDLASGTSSYAIREFIPTPGAVTLLGLAGLVIARRRR